MWHERTWKKDQNSTLQGTVNSQVCFATMCPSTLWPLLFVVVLLKGSEECWWTGHDLFGIDAPTTPRNVHIQNHFRFKEKCGGMNRTCTVSEWSKFAVEKLGSMLVGEDWITISDFWRRWSTLFLLERMELPAFWWGYWWGIFFFQLTFFPMLAPHFDGGES